MKTDFGTLDTETAEAVKTAESSVIEPKVIGKGIYLELTDTDKTSYTGRQTLQILITPEGVAENGKSVGMAIISRNVSNWSPRRQWRVRYLPTPPATTTNQTEWLTTWAIEYVARQVGYGYNSLKANPMVFEVSNLDLTDVQQGKVPAPALRRIIKARVSAGYPAEIYPK